MIFGKTLKTLLKNNFQNILTGRNGYQIIYQLFLKELIRM